MHQQTSNFNCRPSMNPSTALSSIHARTNHRANPLHHLGNQVPSKQLDSEDSEDSESGSKHHSGLGHPSHNLLVDDQNITKTSWKCGACFHLSGLFHLDISHLSRWKWTEQNRTKNSAAGVFPPRSMLMPRYSAGMPSSENTLRNAAVGFGASLAWDKAFPLTLGSKPPHVFGARTKGLVGLLGTKNGSAGLSSAGAPGIWIH